MVRDFVEVLGFDACIPALFRIENYVRPLLAGSKTHIGFHLYIRESFGSDSLLQFNHELLGSSGFTVNVLTHETSPHYRPLFNWQRSIPDHVYDEPDTSVH